MGQICETFTLQTHGRPKMKVFQKTPSKFAWKYWKLAKNRGYFWTTFMQDCSMWPIKAFLTSPPLHFKSLLDTWVMPYTAKYMIIEWILDQIWEQGVLHRNHPPDPPFKTTVQENQKLEFWIGPFLKVVRWPWFSFLNYLKNKPFFCPV